MTRTAFLYLDKNACSVISFWFRIDVIVWRQLEPCVFYAYSFGCTHFLFLGGYFMENATGKVIRTIGQIIIGLGAIASIIIWIAVDYAYNGAFGFGAALGTFVGTFVSGMMFIGFSEIIFLLQENLNANNKKGKNEINKEDELPEI